jgi:hypothetical protein
LEAGGVDRQGERGGGAGGGHHPGLHARDHRERRHSDDEGQDRHGRSGVADEPKQGQGAGRRGEQAGHRRHQRPVREPAAEEVSQHPSNATFVIDRLEEQGLIQRRVHPTDRRAKQIVLTPAGRRMRTKALKRLSTHSPLAPLSATQRDSLRDLLKTSTVATSRRARSVPRPATTGRPSGTDRGRRSRAPRCPGQPIRWDHGRAGDTCSRRDYA